MSEEIKRDLRLILVTGARPGEVIGMHAREINAHWWESPAKRSKNSLPHRVFLTKTAKQLIGKPAGYAFPSPRPGEDDKETPIEENAIAHVLRRNLKGYTRQRAARAKADSSTAAKAETAEDKKLELAHFTPHDLRRTCATQMAEMGQSNEVIDTNLGSQDQRHRRRLQPARLCQGETGGSSGVGKTAEDHHQAQEKSCESNVIEAVTSKGK